MTFARKPRPDRNTLAAALETARNYAELSERFDLSTTTLRRLIDDYGLPRVVDGRHDKIRKERRPLGFEDFEDRDGETYIKPRPRTRLDDLCDQAAQEWDRDKAFHTYRVTRKLDQPPAEPIGPGVNWRDHALCRGLNPGIFHPDPRNAETIALAKQICSKCAAREVCPASETTRHLRIRPRKTAVAA